MLFLQEYIYEVCSGVCLLAETEACLVMFKQILVFNFLGCFKDCNNSRGGKHDCQKVGRREEVGEKRFCIYPFIIG